jgi:putative two-component system response regulator
LQFAIIIAEGHHEKFDGSGYPSGKRGGEIPLCAKIMAVADVYDALVDNRVYRGAMSHEDAYKIIVDGRGTHFDPSVIDAFEAISDDMRREAEGIRG